MIEMRWSVPSGTSSKAPVLQYRTWHVRLDASGAITPSPLPVEWTAWCAVPIEVNEENNSP